MFFRKVNHSSLREALHEIGDKIWTLREEIVVISEAASAVTIEDSVDLDRAFKDLSGKIDTRAFIRLDNSHSRVISNSEFQVFSQPEASHFPPQNLTFRHKNQNFQAKYSISQPRLTFDFSYRISTICHIHSSEQKRVIDVVILITWQHIAR